MPCLPSKGGAWEQQLWKSLRRWQNPGIEKASVTCVVIPFWVFLDEMACMPVAWVEHTGLPKTTGMSLFNPLEDRTQPRLGNREATGSTGSWTPALCCFGLGLPLGNPPSSRSPALSRESPPSDHLCWISLPLPFLLPPVPFEYIDISCWFSFSGEPKVTPAWCWLLSFPMVRELWTPWNLVWSENLF